MPIDKNAIIWDSPTIDTSKIVWDNQPQVSGNGFVRGMMDPIEGAAQGLTHILPASVVNAGNRLNQWLIEKGVPLDPIPQGGIDQQLREQEAAYQQARAAQGDTGVDWTRLAGNIASPANLAMPTATAASLPAKIALGAGQGALASTVFSPVTSGDNYAQEKARQLTTGAAVGAAVPIIGAGLSRAIRPTPNADVELLMKEGVKPTIGQTLGGIAKTTEEKARSIPITGDAITAAHKRILVDFNKAAYNRALTPLGKKLPKDISAGHEAIRYVDEAISNAYDDVLPRLTGKIDSKLQADISGIKSMAQSLPTDKMEQLNRIIDNEFVGKFTSHGLANGQTIKDIESKLGQQAGAYMRSPDPDQRTLGGALRELQDSLRKMLVRQNPAEAKNLTKVNKAYAHYKRVERAMTGTGKQDAEIFTPAQYDFAVKMLDPSKSRKQYALGKAFGQDLSTAGKKVLAQQYPDSGTAGRIALGAGALGAGFSFSPGALAGLGAAAIPYLPGIQPGLASAMTARAPLANAINAAPQYLTPGLAQYIGR